MTQGPPPPWTTVLDRLPATERSVLLLALAAPRLISPDPTPPAPAEPALAAQLYLLEGALTMAPAIVTSIDDMRARELLNSLQPEYEYLVSALASPPPGMQDLAGQLVRSAEQAAERDRALRPWRPTTLLVQAAHLTRGGRLVEALAAVRAATRALHRIDRAARRDIRAQAEATAALLADAIAGQPMTESRAELDDGSYQLDRAGRDLFARDDYPGAHDHYDRSLALAEQWLTASPSDARAIRSVATTLTNRLVCRIEAEEIAEAVADARRAMALFDRLRIPGTRSRDEFPAAEAEAWLAVALADAAELGRPDLAAADLAVRGLTDGDLTGADPTGADPTDADPTDASAFPTAGSSPAWRSPTPSTSSTRTTPRPATPPPTSARRYTG